MEILNTGRNNHRAKTNSITGSIVDNPWYNEEVDHFRQIKASLIVARERRNSNVQKRCVFIHFIKRHLTFW